MQDFANVGVELNEEERIKLIKLFVKNKLKPESQSVFNEQLPDDIDNIDDVVLCNAIYQAALNDIVVECIETIVNGKQNEI